MNGCAAFRIPQLRPAGMRRQVPPPRSHLYADLRIGLNEEGIGMEQQNLKQHKSKYALSSVFFLLLLGITFYWIFRQFHISELLAVMDGLKGGWLLVGLVLTFGYIGGEGLGLHTILKALGHPIRLFSSFVYAATDLYYCGTTPSASGGQPMMLYYMAKDKVPLAKSGIATLFNIVAYKIVLLITGTVTVIAKAGWIQKNGQWWWWLLIAIGFTVNAAMLVLCLLSMFSSTLVKSIGTKGIRLLGRLHLVKHPEAKMDSLEAMINEYSAAAQIIRTNRGLLLRVIGCNFFQRLCMFSITYCVYLSFGLSDLSYLDLLGIQILCALSVDTLPFPGGVGMAEFMTQRLYGGVYPEAIQTPAMLLTRGINFYFCMVVCAITTLLNHLRLWLRSMSNKEETL